MPEFFVFFLPGSSGQSQEIWNKVAKSRKATHYLLESFSHRKISFYYRRSHTNREIFLAKVAQARGFNIQR